MLISVIALIAGLVTAIIGIIGVAVSAILAAPHVRSFTPGAPLLSIIAPILIVWAAPTFGTHHLKKAYNQIAAYTGVHMFKTASPLYLIGAATSIAIVGLLVILTADTLQTVAFLSLPGTY